MATNTTNYGFKKPDESDFYDVADQNKNWDLADEALKNLDTPTFEDYTGSTAVPSATDAIDQIKSKGKLGTLLSNIKAAFKGACLIGHIVNNCVTDNAGLPLSAAQGKVLKDLYTQLYSDKGKAIYSSDLFGKYDSPTFVIWDSNTANCPYKVGLTQGQEGFAIVYGDKSGWHTTLAWQKGGLMSSSVGWIHFFNGGTKIGWSKYVTEDNLNARFMNMSDFTIEKIKSIYDSNIPIVGYINYTLAIAPDGNTGFVLAAGRCAIFISLTGSIYGLTSGNNWEKKN